MLDFTNIYHRRLYTAINPDIHRGRSIVKMLERIILDQLRKVHQAFWTGGLRILTPRKINSFDFIVVTLRADHKQRGALANEWCYKAYFFLDRIPLLAKKFVEFELFHGDRDNILVFDYSVKEITLSIGHSYNWSESHE